MPGKAHDVMHGEEIGRIAEIPHQIEFMPDGLRDLPGDSLRITSRCPLRGEVLKGLLLIGKAYSNPEPI